jgi:ATP-dependent DNA ligase
MTGKPEVGFPEATANDHTDGGAACARCVRREGWLFELKWDGFRTMAETDGTNGVKLYSRNQKDFKKNDSHRVDKPKH